MLFYYLTIGVPLLCLTSAVMYWLDKRRAECNGQRIPESTLLVVDLLGGWPGGWWSQQRFRHKTQKTSFRIRYFLAIGGNLFLIYLLWTVQRNWM